MARMTAAHRRGGAEEDLGRGSGHGTTGMDGSISDPTRQGIHGVDGSPPVKMREREFMRERE